MSSIPLPALNVRTPQQEPYINQVGQAMQLKSMLGAQQLQQGQQQLQQQQLQGAQIENQKGQLDLNSQKAMMKAYQESNGNWSEAIPLAAKYGATPQAMLQLQQAAYQQRMNVMNELNAKGERAQKEADLADGWKDTVNKAPADQKAQVYQQGVQSLGQAGVDVSALPQQYPGDQQFQFLGLGIKGHKQLLEEAAKSSETFKNQQQGEEAQAQAKKANFELGAMQAYGGLNPALAKMKYQSILQKIQSGQPVMPQEMKWAQGYEASERKTSTTSDSLGVMSSNTSGPSGLAAVGKGATGGTAAPNGPSAKESIVDLIGEYKADPSLLGRMLYRHPEVLGLLKQKYPDFDETNYVSKNKLIQGYTSGSQSKEINAIGTSMGHVKALDDAVDALNNNDLTVLNKIGNAYGINVSGKTAAAAFKLIIHRVGPEISSAYIPGGGGEGERVANAQDFSENLPPQTLHNNAAITVKLLRSKVGQLEAQYKNTVGRDDFEQRFLSPEARAAFQKFSPQGGTQGAGAPTGATHIAPGSDGKNHYTNDKGQDLGIAQ